MYKNKKYFIALLFIALLMLGACGSGEVRFREDDLTEHTEMLSESNVYVHDTSAFTEGLFCQNGALCESTGRRGQSLLKKNISLDTGLAESSAELDDTLFGEGATALSGKIYMLTYTDGAALVFDAESLELLETLPYEREGWGLTTDGEYLIAGDGSSKLYFMDEKLSTVKTLEVTFKGKPIGNLNELEYVEGKIWANVWLSDNIVIIDPESGQIETVLSFASIKPEESKLQSSDSVLNGIAFDPHSRKIYITGKNWPSLFEFELK